MGGGSGYGKWGVELFWVGVGIVEVVMEGGDWGIGGDNMIKRR